MKTSHWETTQIRNRRLLLLVGALVLTIGLAVLALEIAVSILSSWPRFWQLTIPQIVAFTSVVCALFAGTTSILSARGSQNVQGAKCTFLSSSLVSAIAAVALTVAIALLLPALISWWNFPPAVSNAPPTPRDAQEPNISTLKSANGSGEATVFQENAAKALTQKEEEELHQQRQVLGRLQTAALIGIFLLLIGTVLSVILTVLNFGWISREFQNDTAGYHLAPRNSTAYQDPRVDLMITD